MDYNNKNANNKPTRITTEGHIFQQVKIIYPGIPVSGGNGVSQGWRCSVEGYEHMSKYKFSKNVNSEYKVLGGLFPTLLEKES